MALKKKKASKAPVVKTKSVAKKSSAKKAVKKTVAKKSIAKNQKPKVAKKTAIKKVAKKITAKPVKKVVKKASPKVVTKKASRKVVNKKAVIAKKAVKPASKAKSTLVKKVVAKKVISKPAKKVETKINVIKKTITAVPRETSIPSTEKVVKIGVKTKKQVVTIAPLPIIEVSNYPKHKVKTVLISQPKPENDKNPYYDLANKYNLIETFRQFIKIEGLPVKDFRAQRIDLLEHKAVILTSRMAVDHYFRMCNEMRVTVPESMKYFCINEATAYYLQKYIQYRKRKIFFGHQTIQDLVDVIRKNREEKFLLPAADVHKEKICEFLDAINIKYTKAVMYRTVSADLSDIKNLNDYDVLAFFTPAGIASLKHNFPNFKQGDTRIACFGAATANALKNNGYRLDIYAPNPKNPSMSGALDDYMKESNKR
jgi:uroporphyrinogen-III synthase